MNTRTSLPPRTRRAKPGLALACLVAALASPDVSRAQSEKLAGPPVFHPAAIEIRHHRHPHSIRVSGTTADGYTVDLVPSATFASADPKVATVDADGWVRPVSSGQTTVSVSASGATKAIPVTVKLPASEPPTSFRHEVMAVLTKTGCNMGACHGYSLGKNGFKLSLRGADPGPDYFAITKDAMGRRISRLIPEASALIAKPRGDAPHEGGTRFAKNSLADRLLRQWVEEGCPADLDDPAEVVAVRVFPDKLVLKPGQRHRVQMIAEYSDGTRRDVSRIGIFAANNVQHADVEDENQAVAGDPGETAIVARFERTFAATSVVVLPPTTAFVPSPVPTGHFIDKHVVEKLNRIKVNPSAVAGDEEFLRRVHLDLIGVQPKPDEVRAFLADADPKKREKAIDALFVRPEFVDHWSLKWGDLLQNSRNTASPAAVYALREFLRGAVASNLPVDALARKLLTARGGAADDPASVYLASSKDVADTVERTTQVFAGVRMLCARCHAHPMENWTQADYYGLASFFNQASVRPDPRLPGIANAKVLQVNAAAGFATNPRTNKAQPPRFLGGAEPKLAADVDRRIAYAEWLTSPDNPLFAKSIVNRFWAAFFHRGIIEPVDDLRSTNPPVNPELLDALTKDFVAHRFDLRHLMRRIVTSETYQRSSVPTPTNRYDEQNFSRAVPRRIPAEALLDSMVQATGVPESFGGVPAGFRAAQIPDGNVENPFLKLFGKPQRMDACECERDNTSNMLQALHFINSKSILSRVQNTSARPQTLAKQKLDDAQLATELYLWSLSRRPSDAELRVAVTFLKSVPPDRRPEAAQDLMWALLNTRDFLLNH